MYSTRWWCPREQPGPTPARWPAGKRSQVVSVGVRRTEQPARPDRPSRSPAVTCRSSVRPSPHERAPDRVTGRFPGWRPCTPATTRHRPR